MAEPIADRSAWGEALAALLSSHDGYCPFAQSAERHNHGRLDDDHRLNLFSRGMDRIFRARREVGLPRVQVVLGEAEGCLAVLVPNMLKAGRA